MQSAYEITMLLYDCIYRKVVPAAGFEPTRAEPNGFLVHLVNHSDTLPQYRFITIMTALRSNAVRKLNIKVHPDGVYVVHRGEQCASIKTASDMIS